MRARRNAIEGVPYSSIGTMLRTVAQCESKLAKLTARIGGELHATYKVGNAPQRLARSRMNFSQFGISATKRPARNLPISNHIANRVQSAG